MTTTVTLTIEGSPADVLKYVGQGFGDGLVTGFAVVDEAPAPKGRGRGQLTTRTPAPRSRKGALRAGDVVRVRLAGHGCDAGDTGTVEEVSKRGRGYSALVKWDDGTAPSLIPASSLTRRAA